MFRRVAEKISAFARETRGQELAEAAVVLPLVFMVLLGIFWFGQAFSIYGAITRAAQEGARAGSIPYCITCNSPNTPGQNAVTAVQTALVGSKLDPTKARQPSPAPSLLACSSPIPPPPSVGCGSESTNFCIQTSIQLTSTGLGATGLCGSALDSVLLSAHSAPCHSVRSICRKYWRAGAAGHRWTRASWNDWRHCHLRGKRVR